MYEGMPPRLYRTPEEIKTDIYDVKRKIAAFGEMLNVRNVIAEMFDETACGGSRDWLRALRCAVEDAEASLESLRELNDTLDGLVEELRETRCILRI